MTPLEWLLAGLLLVAIATIVWLDGHARQADQRTQEALDQTERVLDAWQAATDRHTKLRTITDQALHGHTTTRSERKNG